jgi:hypothetical protein
LVKNSIDLLRFFTGRFTKIFVAMFSPCVDSLHYELSAERPHDAAVDAARAAGFDQVVIHFGNVLNLSVEDLFVKLRQFRRILR